MKKVPFFTAVFCFVVLPSVIVAAQPAITDNDTITNSKPVVLFYRSINENAHLYNGSEYIMYDPRVKGDPYFNATDLNNGSVFYDGTLYDSIPMLYELTTDRIIIRMYNGGLLMNLVNEKTGYFKLLGHTFIHIVPDSSNAFITDGFYDRVYSGNTTLYVRRQKILYEDPVNFEKSFVIHDRYFIYKGNTWYPVSGENDVMSVFKDKKKDIARYLRQNKIKFKKAPEYTMIKMAGYYDQLTH